MTVITLGNALNWWNILVDPKHKNYPHLGTINQIAGILSLLTSVFIGLYQIRLAKKPVIQAPRAEEQPQRDQPHETVSPPVIVPRRSPGIVDRTEEISVLRERLMEGASGIVIVTGPPGVGKAELVEEVLWHLEHASLDPPGTSRPRVVRHEIAPDLDQYAGIDVGMLVADIENLSDDDAALRKAISLQHSPLDQLTAALEKHRDAPVVIAIRHAESLFDPVTRQLRDPELDEAFEILTKNTQHRVSVVLTTRHPPKSLGQGTWAERWQPIAVKGLRPGDFLEYVKRLAGEETLVSNAVAGLHGLLQGNPRNTQLSCAAFRFARETSAELAAEIRHRKSGDGVLGFLIQRLIAGLNPLERRALQALDAYGTSVRLDAVCALVVEEHHEPHPADEVQNALTKLVERHLAVETAQGEYRLSLSEAERKWAGLPNGDGPVDERSYELLRRAGYELHDRRVTPPRSLADLRVALAELRALMRAGDLWDRAYNRIEDELDPELRKRNRMSLLLETREKLRGKLGSERREMANHNALGELYASRGDFTKANQAYSQALEYANLLRSLPYQTVIRANWAGAYWRHFEVETAYGYFELARDDHDKLLHSNPEVYRDLLPLRMNIFEGLADCHRHWGEYTKAIEFAKRARAVTESEGYPRTPEARDLSDRGRLSIGMKLARWHLELGDREAADRLDESVRLELNGHDQDWLQSVYQDGHACLLLDRDDVEEAIRTAQRAVELAREFTDPVILLQARTTLCLAYLENDDLDAAARQVEAAMPYRHRGGSLLPPALHALVAVGLDPDSGGGQAVERFRLLLAEAEERIQQDRHDVAAWDFKGFAGCGLFLYGEGELKDAIAAFLAARTTTRDVLRTREPTPGLVEQWISLLELLDAYGRPPRLLRPVIDVLCAMQARTSGS
ncbi:tetratricopeptide repeat protein [Nonomuraea wenchangensis]|uniref:tetratricopeptide repeat protein n=1 Tax=Nonomuraea wenchangensis TaxID=568860 RepID=UPI00116070E4|nr:hypothetical protein [Nonomuraea wenchangensis]